ncbi:MAG TPA: ATP-binding protein, partial [Kofleriaceae bacterium]|nr:ATP-binding protein [Kofleriaceae bacterium]
PQLAALSPHAAAVLPLVVRGRRLGALALGFPAERRFGAWDQAVANDVALLVAHALDRTLAYEAAERATRAKDEFFAMLGHELRNPLSPILTAIQLMRLRDETYCAKERSIIERQALGLVRLVDDLLDVARIERGTLGIERRRVELAAVIAAAAEQMGPVLAEGGHRLALDVPDGITVDVDAVRMVQVFSSLLGNAAKYSPCGGAIELAARPAADTIAVSVRDHGEGIEPALLGHVFEVFVQGPPRSDRARSGLGVGLAIARAIVGMHGGTIRAESDGPGRGSVFTVELPCPRDEAYAPDPAAEVRELGETRPKRLLLVDDNEDSVGLLALWLAKRGHDVRVAYHPRNALAIAREFRPDVAVLDIGLPEMDGYQLADALRAQQPEAPIRLIALTGYGQPSDRSRSAGAGFAAHLVKPVDLGVFQDAIAGRSEPAART